MTDTDIELPPFVGSSEACKLTGLTIRGLYRLAKLPVDDPLHLSPITYVPNGKHPARRYSRADIVRWRAEIDAGAQPAEPGR